MGRPRIYKPCPECGKTFYGQRTYCSDECTRKAGKPLPKRNGNMVSCVICGKEFYLPQYRIDRTNDYTCCNAHQIEWQSRNKIKRICATCDKIFWVSPSRVKFDAAKFCSIKCRDAHPDTIQHIRNMNQKQQTIEQTSIEKIGYTLLDQIGIHYEPQYLVDDKFCVDAYIPSIKLVIQFDGDYWHGHPDKFSTLDYRQQKRVNVDKSQNKYFQKHGYKLLRFWGSDLRDRIDWVSSQIQSMI